MNRLIIDDIKLDRFNNVLNITSKVTQIKTPDILGKCRKDNIVEARRLVCYILREHYKYTWHTIKELMGFNDHTSVLHHCKNHINLTYDKSYQSKYNQIIKQLEL
jgi:chromosomal replication initiation ATPase DnaA